MRTRLPAIDLIDPRSGVRNGAGRPSAPTFENPDETRKVIHTCTFKYG